MKHKKILLTLLIFTLLVITLSLTAFAMPNFVDGNPVFEPSGSVFVSSNYLNLGWLNFVEIPFNDYDGKMICVSLFSIIPNALLDELNCEAFLTSGKNAAEYLNFMSLGSISYFYNSPDYYTNLDELISQINYFGDYLKLNSVNQQLTNDNYQLNNQLISLNEGFYMLQQNYNTLADENVILKQTVENLKQNSGDGYTAAIDVMRMWFNDRGYSYELSDSSVASVIFRDELETNILALKQAAYMEGETAGLNSGEIAKDGILSIFSAPFYFLSNVLNFEILGINLYSIISFLITTAVVVFFFKKIRG